MPSPPAMSTLGLSACSYGSKASHSPARSRRAGLARCRPVDRLDATAPHERVREAGLESRRAQHARGERHAAAHELVADPGHEVQAAVLVLLATGPRKLMIDQDHVRDGLVP
jgi:hypothetical protein